MWQEFYRSHRGPHLELVAVAMDAQGPQKALPFVQKAGATFPCLVDEENVLGGLFGFKVIPNGLLIDEKGVLHYKKFGGFDIRLPEIRPLVTRWGEGQAIDDASAATKAVAVQKQLLEHFRRGVALYRTGKVDQALEEWRRGLKLDPENFILRKQIWAVSHPERFYQGDIDLDWQKEQLAKGL